MYCVPKICLILCTIPLIKAVSLKIDGLINLGENWSYEYRVFRSGANHSDYQDDSKAGQKGDAEKLRILEKRLRQEAAEYRKEVHQKDLVHTDKRHKRQKDKKNSTIHNTKHVEKHISKASSSSSETSSSDVSAEPEKATAMIYDETTKKTQKILRFIDRDYTETQESLVSRDSSESSASWIDKTRHITEDRAAVINHYVSPRAPRGLESKTLGRTLNKTKASTLNKTKESTLYKTKQRILNKIKESVNSTFTTTVATLSTSSQVTTVRTENIYTDTHIVKDDAKITEFTNHLYKQTLKLFDAVKKKTNQDHLKGQVDILARSYEVKFKEFLRDTSSQKIKTRLGTQKVILNTIDMSNRILRRLMNFMIGDLDKKGVLRHNAGSANVFQKAIETEQKLQLVHACKKFGICRSGQGFSAFLIEILTTLLNCDDIKFKQSIDAFTETVKYMSFENVFGGPSEKKLKQIIEKIEMQDIQILRVIVLILKNTITNQNKPMIVNNFSARQRIVNSTLALLEIIDLLDTKIPRNESNVLEWADMKNSFAEFAADKRYDILEITTAFVKHVKKNLKSLDEDSQRIISKNLALIFN